MARCNSSYTSLVYQEKEPVSGPSLSTMIQSLVEWLIILQRLEEERRSDMPPVFCRCVKAVNLNDELKTVARGLTEASRLSERVAPEAVTPQLEAVSQDLVRLAGLLRADVSILIPGNIGRAEPGVAEQARSVLAEVEAGGVSGLVAETVESVTRLVYSLLGVDTCSHCSGENLQGVICWGDYVSTPDLLGEKVRETETEAMEDQDIDPDIMNMVAAMCGDYSRLPNKENEDRSVQRKYLESDYYNLICFSGQGPTLMLGDKFLKGQERENKTVQVNFSQHLYL